MWHRKVESSWMRNAGKNSFSVQLPPNAKNQAILIIRCTSEHIKSDQLPFVLHDKSGLDHQLPLMIKNDEFAKYDSFKITGGCSDPEIHFKISCIFTGWPKELQNPIVNFYSITTVKISPAEDLDKPHYGKYRKKGTDDWLEGTLITFDRSDEIYECQVYYKLIDNDPVSAIYSPITDITCLWKNFNMETEATLDAAKMIDKKFAIHFNPTYFYNTQYTSTLKLLSPNNNENYDKEIVVKSVDQVIEDVPLIHGAQYEYKMTIMNLNVSYTKVFTTNIVEPVDNDLWIRFFGEADQQTFTHHTSRIITYWIDFHEGEREEIEADLLYWYLTIKKDGFWQIKHDFQEYEHCEKKVTGLYGGTFTVIRSSDINSGNNFKINLVKTYSSKVTKPSWTVKSAQIGQSFIQRQAPPALQIHDIINHIVRYAEDYLYERRLELRLVCKIWCLAIHPNELSCIVSATECQLFGFEIQPITLKLPN